MNIRDWQRKERTKVDYLLYLYRKALGIDKNLADSIFADCDNRAALYDKLLLDTSAMRALFLDGTTTGLGNLCESDVAGLLEAEWSPRPGYDVRTIIEFRDGPRIITVEVRGCRPFTKGDTWRVRITDGHGDLEADFIIVVAMSDTYNPAYAHLFAIPRGVLLPRIKRVRDKRDEREQQDPSYKRGDPRVKITIQKSPINVRTGERNQWWEYLVNRHIDLDLVISGKSRCEVGTSFVDLSEEIQQVSFLL